MNPNVELKGEKVCMVTANTMHNKRFVEMGDLASKVNMDYCRRYGYGFRMYTSGFAEERHPSWSKILFVREVMKEYPWVMWIDADAIVTNPETRLERFLDDRYMVVVAKQNWNKDVWYDVNFGVFFAKGGVLLDEFFDRVWADFPHKELGWEQASVQKLIKDEPYKSMVKVVCRRDFNSVVVHESLGIPGALTDSYGLFDCNTEAWGKGDFVAHYGWRRDDVVEAMKATLAECGVKV